MKRKVTKRELDALSNANRELLAAIPGAHNTLSMGVTVAGGAMQEGDPTSALNAMLMGLAGSVNPIQALLQNFERAASNFLGETLKPGEGLGDFHNRICRILNTEGDENATLRAILAVQERNGITWNFMV